LRPDRISQNGREPPERESYEQQGRGKIAKKNAPKRRHAKKQPLKPHDDLFSKAQILGFKLDHLDTENWHISIRATFEKYGGYDGYFYGDNQTVQKGGTHRFTDCTIQCQSLSLLLSSHRHRHKRIPKAGILAEVNNLRVSR
jgi:hypothetical protein